LLPINGINVLPALQWKLKNINNLKVADPEKYQDALYKLQKALNV